MGGLEGVWLRHFRYEVCCMVATINSKRYKNDIYYLCAQSLNDHNMIHIVIVFALHTYTVIRTVIKVQWNRKLCAHK